VEVASKVRMQSALPSLQHGEIFPTPNGMMADTLLQGIEAFQSGDSLGPA
jgi:hypothetical protein